MNRYTLLILLLIALLAGCSSLRKPLQPQAKLNADNALKLAQDHEQQRRFTNSEDSYNYALELYRSFGDVSGQMHCLAGLHRLDTEQHGNSASSYYYMQMADIVRLVDPSQEPILLLANLYSLMKEANYWLVAEKALIKDSYSPVEKMQILSYKVQADAYLGNSSDAEIRQLTGLVGKHLRRPLKKRKINPQVVSEAAYALAYHYYIQGDNDRSLRYLEHSSEVDFVYGNFVSLGYSVWLKGKNYMAKGDNDKAISELLRARGIFEVGANLQMRNKCDEDLRELGAQLYTE